MNQTEDAELSGWETIEQTAHTNNPTSSTQATTQAAKKLVYAIANLRLALNSHQKITADRMDRLTKGLDDFNRSSGSIAKAANWIAVALVILGVAQVVVALLNR